MGFYMRNMFLQEGWHLRFPFFLRMSSIFRPYLFILFSFNFLQNCRSSADFHLLGVQDLTKDTREEDSRPSADELFVARWRRRRFSLSRYSKTWSSWTALWWSSSYSCECCWNPVGVSRCPCSHLSSEPLLSCVSPKPWQHFSPVCWWFIRIFPSSFCFRKQSLVLSSSQKLSSGRRETRNFWSVNPPPIKLSGFCRSRFLGFRV